VAWITSLPATSLAKPSAPALVCATYPGLPDCMGTLVACTSCHVTIDPPAWNAFGESLRKQRSDAEPFETWLPDALRAVEGRDADADGMANLDELVQGTQPGDASSKPAPADDATELFNPRYVLGDYDARFAYRRMAALYCGRSPSYEDMQAFSAAPADEQTLRKRLHAALSRCLESEYWQKTALPRLADPRIRPLYAAGPESQVMITAELRLVIGDYNYDYRLWRYVLSNDHDARELLTARYHVVEDPQGKLVERYGVIPQTVPDALTGGQPLAEEHRAGMLTTQWFLSINTMFSALPRTSAAHAYRSYLGADISMSEGLRPVAGEPVDVDGKGVAQERCAVCHSTLDPLSYAFASYEGIAAPNTVQFGSYRPERALEMIPAWDPAKQRSVLLGQEVASVVEWARVASESDQFLRNLAEMFFRHALGRMPLPAEQAEFVALWRSLPEHGYSANQLIHQLVDTLAFGRP
jgi:hypothetical protein